MSAGRSSPKSILARSRGRTPSLRRLGALLLLALLAAYSQPRGTLAPARTPMLPTASTVPASPVAYVGSLADVVTALDATDGSMRWQHGEAGTWWSFPAVDGGTLYATSVQAPPTAVGQDLWFAASAVYALDPTDGRVRWRYDVRGLEFAPVTLA